MGYYNINISDEKSARCVVKPHYFTCVLYMYDIIVFYIRLTC